MLRSRGTRFFRRSVVAYLPNTAGRRYGDCVNKALENLQIERMEEVKYAGTARFGNSS
ncbi:hypothetical protein KCP75_16250 [Salmonella enterica subsp. enterica]|nr:hypothetical protein KCP75_16250 [Salmonella enterica subsp. enterica]